MSTPTKPAAKKTTASPFNRAVREGDSNAAINIMLAKLDESNEIANRLLEHIAAQDRIIMQYRGLSALALAQGTR